ncbi:MAG TPA: phosphodiester glycosidase family protein [Candidatus Binatia bacterium]|nr:phosphodiester glycosidase family protein [Candidatus Binatia bacterium]
MLIRDMMNRRAVATTLTLFSLFVFVVSVFSQALSKAKLGSTLTITDNGNWRAIQKGVQFRKIVLERSEPSYTVELKLLRFDSRLILPKILSAEQFQLKAASAKTFTEKSGALAAINANYFDENIRPLAYLKTAVKEINRTVSKHGLYTGIFGLRESVPFVIHRDDFQPLEVNEALQSGPLLLRKGAPVEIMNGLGRHARRSVIGVDKEGRMIVAVTDTVIGGLSFSELQELFSNSKSQVETPDLLNLDGGGSTQLYAKTGKFEEWLPGTSEVPVAIAFFNKP